MSGKGARGRLGGREWWEGGEGGWCAGVTRADPCRLVQARAGHDRSVCFYSSGSAAGPCPRIPNSLGPATYIHTTPYNITHWLLLPCSTLFSTWPIPTDLDKYLSSPPTLARQVLRTTGSCCPLKYPLTFLQAPGGIKGVVDFD